MRNLFAQNRAPSSLQIKYVCHVCVLNKAEVSVSTLIFPGMQYCSVTLVCCGIFQLAIYRETSYPSQLSAHISMLAQNYFMSGHSGNTKYTFAFYVHPVTKQWVPFYGYYLFFWQVELSLKVDSPNIKIIS